MESTQNGIDQRRLEKVQMRASDQVHNCNKASYAQTKTTETGLTTLRFRRIREDMIKVYEILTYIYCKKFITIKTPSG